MSRRLRILTFLTVLTLSVAGVAAASEHEGEEEPEATGDELVDSWFWYDMEVMQLTYALTAEGEDPIDCFPDEPAGDGEEAAATTEEPPAELPEGCVTIDVVGPSGKVTHGSVVSAFVHSLNEDYDKATYGPKGQWVREVAWSDHGKKWEEDAAGDTDAEALEDSTEGKKPKKPKKPNKGNGRNG